MHMLLMSQLRKSAETGDIDTITRTLENTEKDCGINVDCGLDPVSAWVSECVSECVSEW